MHTVRGDVSKDAGYQPTGRTRDITFLTSGIFCKGYFPLLFKINSCIVIVSSFFQSVIQIFSKKTMQQFIQTT